MATAVSGFEERVRLALSDHTLQSAMRRSGQGLANNRNKAVALQPEFEQWRDAAAEVCDHTLDSIDAYLEQFETAATSNGARVHWARDAAQANSIIRSLCRDYGATTVLKSKSMVTEEVELNHALEQGGVEVVETDLGEYIIQLRGEKPSHIIAPASHLTRQQVEKTFRQAHQQLDATRELDTPVKLVREARRVLRKRFGSAQVGITGANFLVAETGEIITVTNEGNADHVQYTPPHLITLTGIDKVVPTRREAMLLLRLLARSATGQESSVYTTWVRGPRHGEEARSDADTFDIVLLDNGRADMLGSEFREMLRCIRCSACMSHCPVYQSIGGHAYGAVYPGPMGSVLTPWFNGLSPNRDLPNASTLCGKCGTVCPVKIPLPKLLHGWRVREFNDKVTPVRQRFWLKIWAMMAQHPRLYRLAEWSFAWLTRGWGWVWRGRIGIMPLASRWTRYRDFPVPQAPSAFPWSER